MESGVEIVNLVMVTCDMETLVTYSGRGRCGKVILDWYPKLLRVNLKEPLKIWAMNRDWAVIVDNRSELVIKRR